uniref:Uncharacterized protein n=1 Tax=Oryza barthii TaxID=65489 RepID=A0A0D3GPG1_9ORYZ
MWADGGGRRRRLSVVNGTAGRVDPGEGGGGGGRAGGVGSGDKRKRETARGIIDICSGSTLEPFDPTKPSCASCIGVGDKIKIHSGYGKFLATSPPLTLLTGTKSSNALSSSSAAGSRTNHTTWPESRLRQAVDSGSGTGYGASRCIGTESWQRRGTPRGERGWRTGREWPWRQRTRETAWARRVWWAAAATALLSTPSTGCDEASSTTAADYLWLHYHHRTD